MAVTIRGRTPAPAHFTGRHGSRHQPGASGRGAWPPAAAWAPSPPPSAAFRSRTLPSIPLRPISGPWPARSGGPRSLPTAWAWWPSTPWWPPPSTPTASAPLSGPGADAIVCGAGLPKDLPALARGSVRRATPPLPPSSAAGGPRGCSASCGTGITAASPTLWCWRGRRPGAT